LVNSFHQLATVENIYSNVVEPNISELDFNNYLFELKKQSVLDTMMLMLDQHRLYNNSFDYATVIEEKAPLFDAVLGFTIAIKTLEMFLSTTRSNATERSNAFSVQMLKVELEGAKNENGYLIAQGIFAKRDLALRRAHKILFPEPIELHGEKIW
jgi:hypothetical protein